MLRHQESPDSRSTNGARCVTDDVHGRDFGKGLVLNEQLQTALEELIDGNPEEAVRQLRDFVREVGALVELGDLPGRDGDRLIADANELVRTFADESS